MQRKLPVAIRYYPNHAPVAYPGPYNVLEDFPTPQAINLEVRDGQACRLVKTDHH